MQQIVEVVTAMKQFLSPRIRFSQCNTRIRGDLPLVHYALRRLPWP
jgi:hypothetical protein